MNQTLPIFEHGAWLRASDQPAQLADDAAALFRYWASLAQQQGAPTRAQIDPLTHFPRLMPTTMLIGVERDAEHGLRFRYRVVGSELTTRAGRELTGKYIDECFPRDDLRADFDIYRRCIAEQRSYWGRRSSIVATRREWEIYNRIILPIRDAGGESVDFLWIYIWFES